MKREYESEAFQVLHEEWLDMHSSGIVSDEELREFERDCFIQEEEINPEDETGPKAKKSPKKKPATA